MKTILPGKIILAKCMLLACIFGLTSCVVFPTPPPLISVGHGWHHHHGHCYR